MGERRRDTLLSCVKRKEDCCEFLKSLKREYNTSLNEFTGNHSKKLIVGVTEILQELSQKQLDVFWNDILKLSFDALENISGTVAEENGDEGKHMDIDDGGPVDVLQMSCVLLLATVRLEKPVASSEIIQALTLLHGSLFDLYDLKSSLAVCICTICVEWWNKKLASREDLCLNAITLLLTLFFQSNKHDKFNAVCSMKDCLVLFDFRRQIATRQPVDEETYTENVIEGLRQKLIESFRKKEFLSNPTGRKFLSFVLLLHKDLMKDVHQSLMDTIGHKFPLEQAEALGSVYFQSWRTAEPEMKESVEEICVQDLMFRTAHAPRAKDQNSFDPLRAMLLSIICHKTSLEVRHMITRLYGPILWRSLKAINSMVRANAATLFLDAFPLQEENSNGPRTVESEEYLQRQYEPLNDMLMDNCHRIRVIGILGLCDILHLYWDALPPNIVAILARKLYNDLAFDASTVEVRQAVFKGTITLLDTPCAHPLLAKLLPTCMDKCLHDVSEKVRILAADVLLAVKQTSTISFWSVCPVENIIAQLEIDGIPVSKRLVKLLFRSFVPEDKPVQVWVERCVNFFKRNINAARKFYLLIDKDFTVQEIGEFLNMIGIYLYNCVTKALQQENSSMAENETFSNDSTAQNMANVSQMSNTPIEEDVLAALLDTSCILWRSLHLRKSGKNREMMKKVMDTFSRTIHVCFKVANDERMLNALLLLSSFLPPASLPVFSKGILPKLRSLPDDAPSSYYEMLIKCICSWNWTKQVLELVSEWLLEGTSEFENENARDMQTEGKDTGAQEASENPPASRRSARVSQSKKKKKKVVMFTGVEQPLRPSQALKYLNTFLKVQSNCSFNALDKEPCLEILLTIVKSLQKCQGEITKRVSSSSTSASKTWPNSLLLEAFSCRFRLLTIIYLHQKSKTPDKNAAGDAPPIRSDVPIEEFQSVTGWFCEILKKHESVTKAQSDLNTSIISNEVSSTTLLARLSFYRQLFNSSLSTFFDLLSCGIDVFDHVEDAILQFCVSDMNFVEYVGKLLKLLHQLHEHKVLKFCVQEKNNNETLTNGNQEEENKLNIKLIEIYDSFLNTLLQHARRTPESFTQLFRQDLRQTLRTLVREQHLAYSKHPEKVWYDVMIKKSVSAILADLFHEVRSSRHFLSQSRISDLPVFSAALLPSICATSAETASVCEIAIRQLVSEETADSTEQMKLVFALLLYVLSQDGKNKVAAAACISTVSQEVPGFDAAILKVKNATGSPSKEEFAEGAVENGDEENEEETIHVLENVQQQDMFVNDEIFMI